MGLTLTGSHTLRTQFGAQLQCVTGPQAVPGELALKIYYGGSEVPSPGITFTYRENPVLRAFEPLRSFVRCDRGPLVAGAPYTHPIQLFPRRALPSSLVRIGRCWSGGQEASNTPPCPPRSLPPRHPGGQPPCPLSAGWQCSGHTCCKAGLCSHWPASMPQVVVGGVRDGALQGTRRARCATLALSPPCPSAVAAASTSQDRVSA